MAKQSDKQQEIVERVMHDFGHGDLKTGTGAPVKSRKQAIAIALSEAGESNQQTPAQNRKRLRKTSAREQRDAQRAPTRASLYEEARRRNLPGRSTMSKAELEQALR